MVRIYGDLRALVRAVRRGSVPESVVSPGWAARVLGVSRQRVHALIAAGALDCWRTEAGDVILVAVDSVNRRADIRSHGQRQQAA